MNSYGHKPVTAGAGTIAAATFWGQFWLVAGIIALVVLIALIIRYFWRSGRGPWS